MHWQWQFTLQHLGGHRECSALILFCVFPLLLLVSLSPKSWTFTVARVERHTFGTWSVLHHDLRSCSELELILHTFDKPMAPPTIMRVPSVSLLRAFLKPLPAPCTQVRSKSNWMPRERFAKTTRLDKLHRQQKAALRQESMCPYPL